MLITAESFCGNRKLCLIHTVSGNAVSCDILFPEVSINPFVDVKEDGIVLEPVTDSSAFCNDLIMSKSDIWFLHNGAVTVIIILIRRQCSTQSYMFWTWYIFFQSCLNLQKQKNDVSLTKLELAINSKILEGELVDTPSYKM